MKTRFRVPAVLIAVGVLYACGDDGHEHDHDHDEIVVPAEYADLTNPLAGDDAAVTAGMTIYAAQCSRCHGDTGTGDGGDGVGLDPAVPDLTTMSNAELTDGYLFWRITEGGAAPFFSSMPAYRNDLSETERWQVITATRTVLAN